MQEQPPERHQAIVIGAGQSGLAAAYHLSGRGFEVLVLEQNGRVGDNWRSRYRSLRLYSPAGSDGLPGTPFPLPPHEFPSGTQMGDYLEAYAKALAAEVRTGIAVDGLYPAVGDGGYLITAGDRRFEAPQVVIAGGFFRHPHVPEFAVELDRSIVQLHSSEYRDPSDLADGPVLVVGVSHSGADLALEAVRNGHPTMLSGHGHGQLPFSIESRAGRVAWPLLKFLATNVLTVRTPIGRKMAPNVRKGGAPLLRVRKGDLQKAGVELIDARTEGVRNGRPQLGDGRVLDVANVLWCTGFRPDYAWMHLPIFDEDGLPRQSRGEITSAPGLYVLGLPFQYGFASMLVLGADRDAEHVARRAAANAEAAGA